MKKFIIRPDIDLFEGIVVEKDTNLKYKSEIVNQKLENLRLISTIKNKAENYTSTTKLTIFLNVGDIVLFEEERGYYLPNIPMSTINDALEDLTVLKSLDKE